uniref:Exonuclease domain-containing protein n=1 Tax=Heterorhabditis bacteriophora TaxID=37862 RepID=A0A1I7XSW6_HETBA
MSLPSGHSSIYLPEETTSVECCNNIHQIASGEETIDKTIEETPSIYFGGNAYPASKCQFIILAMDFECTCSDTINDYPHEIIEFPAVLIDVRNMRISGFESVPHEFRYFINIKRIFEQRIKKLPRRNGKTGIQNMLGHYNISFEGRTHCGLDDSINIARLCIKFMQDKIELRINQRLTMCQDKSKDHQLDHEMLGGTNTDCYVCHRKLPLKLRELDYMLIEMCYDVQDITLACLVIWPDVTIYQRSVAK